MRAAPLLCTAALALTACASAPGQPGQPGQPGEQATNQNDCAVIAAVAKGHYQFGPGNVPPPLWLFSEDASWKPRCDWSRYGVSFPTTYDPNRQHQPGDRVQYVQFQKPVYDGRGATIEAGILHGPLAGMGVRCRVVSGVAGWTWRASARTPGSPDPQARGGGASDQQSFSCSRLWTTTGAIGEVDPPLTTNPSL